MTVVAADRTVRVLARSSAPVRAGRLSAGGMRSPAQRPRGSGGEAGGVEGDLGLAEGPVVVTGSRWRAAARAGPASCRPPGAPGPGGRGGEAAQVTGESSTAADRWSRSGSAQSSAVTRTSRSPSGPSPGRGRGCRGHRRTARAWPRRGSASRGPADGRRAARAGGGRSPPRVSTTPASAVPTSPGDPGDLLRPVQIVRDHPGDGGEDLAVGRPGRAGSSVRRPRKPTCRPVEANSAAGHAAAEPGREQVLAPGAYLGERTGSSLASTGRWAPLSPRSTSASAPGGLEVAAQGIDCARGGQRDVSTSFGIADGEPPGIEGQDPAQRLRGPPELDGSGLHRGADVGQLLPQTHQGSVALHHVRLPRASPGNARPLAAYPLAGTGTRRARRCRTPAAGW